MPDDRICGPRAVAAVFDRRPDAVNRLYYTDSAKEQAGPLCALLAQARRPYRLLPDDEMQRAAGTAHHGGICALATQRPVPMLDWEAPPRHTLMLVLDGIGNPHNLGAIVRSAAFFGAGAVLMHERPDQAMPSDAAYRVAEGAMEHVALYRTRSLRKTIMALDPWYRSVAATLTADAVPPAALPRDRPVLLVLGNEEQGVSREALDTCRRRVRIPGRPAVQSLNVAQAAAVLLYALS